MRELLLGAADWWLGTAIGGGLVLLAGCGLMRLARQPAARQRLGEYAVLAALIVAGLRLLPAWLPLPWTPAAETPVAETAAPPLEFTWVAIAEQAGPPELAAANDPTPETAAPLGWTWYDAFAGLMAGYLVVAAGLAARWLLGQWALNRLLRQARPAAPRVRRLFKAMAADTLWMAPRLCRRTHLRVARRLRAPVCFGLRRPAVLLPEPMDDAAEAQLRWVFAHELTHLRRRDPWSSWGIGLAQAVFFFLPQFWWIRRQVRLCQEYVADAAAAKAGAAADEYAEFLVSLARGSAPPLGATGLGSSSDLLRRVQMLLQSSTRVQGSWPRSRSLLAAGGMLAVAVLAGGVGLRAEPPKDETKTEERKNIVVTVRDGVVTERDAQTDGEPVRVFVRRLEDREDNKGDSDGKPADKKTEKKTAKMVIMIDTGSGPAIQIDGNAEDMPKAIEKAMKKAHEQIAAAQIKRSQSTEKALELLKGELSDEQLKQLQRHIEALRAQKGAAGAERAIAEKARAAAGKALEDARGQLEKAEGEVKRRQVFVSPEGFGGTMKMDGVHAGMMGMAHGGSRLGVFIKKPGAAELADQLDLPKDQGLIVIELVKDSAAAKAGLKVNDIILELAGKPIPSDPGKFVAIVHELKSDEKAPVIVLRKGHKEKVVVEVPEPKKDGPATLWQGFGPHGIKLDGNFEFTPEVKPDGAGNFQWHVIPKAAPPKGTKLDEGDEPKVRKIEKSVNRTVSIQISDDKFVAELKEGDVAIRATGTVNDGKKELTEVRITDPDGKSVYKQLADVPQKYRASVKSLLSNADGSPVKLQFDYKRQEK